MRFDRNGRITEKFLPPKNLQVGFQNNGICFFFIKKSNRDFLSAQSSTCVQIDSIVQVMNTVKIYWQ